MKASIKIEGLGELREKLLALGPEVGAKTLRSAARVAMAPVLEEARRLAPVDTAQLRESIVLVARMPKSGDAVARVGLKIKALGSRPNLRGLKVGKSTKQAVARMSAHWRWHFAEFGTARHRATPFLRPALAKHRESVVETLKAEIKKRIDAVWKKRARSAAKLAKARGA